MPRAPVSPAPVLEVEQLVNNGTPAIFSSATTAGWQSGIKVGFYGDKALIAGIAASNPDAYIKFDLTIDHSAIPAGTADWYQTAVAANSGPGGWNVYSRPFGSDRSLLSLS